MLSEKTFLNQPQRAKDEEVKNKKKDNLDIENPSRRGFLKTMGALAVATAVGANKEALALGKDVVDKVEQETSAEKFSRVQNIYQRNGEIYNEYQKNNPTQDFTEANARYDQWLEKLFKDIKKEANLDIEPRNLKAYFLENDFFIESTWRERSEENPHYIREAKMYPVREKKQEATNSYFSYNFPNAPNFDVPVFILGKELVGTDSVLEKDSITKGTYNKGRIFIYLGDAEEDKGDKLSEKEVNDTLANEMGHAFFEKVLGFKKEHARIKFQYEGEDYIIHQLDEAFSDLSSLVHGDFVEVANKRLLYSAERKGYEFSKTIFKKIFQDYIDKKFPNGNFSTETFLLALSDLKDQNKLGGVLQKIRVEVIKKAKRVFFDELIPLAKKNIETQ